LFEKIEKEVFSVTQESITNIPKSISDIVYERFDEICEVQEHPELVKNEVVKL